jgi:hypothetical protein
MRANDAGALGPVCAGREGVCGAAAAAAMKISRGVPREGSTSKILELHFFLFLIRHNESRAFARRAASRL